MVQSSPYTFGLGDSLFYSFLGANGESDWTPCTFLGKSSEPGFSRVHFDNDGDVYHVSIYLLRRRI